MSCSNDTNNKIDICVKRLNCYILKKLPEFHPNRLDSARGALAHSCTPTTGSWRVWETPIDSSEEVSWEEWAAIKKILLKCVVGIFRAS